jgi:hypothetical protein
MVLTDNGETSMKKMAAIVFGLISSKTGAAELVDIGKQK